MKKLDSLFMLILVSLSLVHAYRIGRNQGYAQANVEADKYWMEAVLSRHLAYLVKQEGKESHLRFRHVPKVRRTPVIVLDENGKEMN